MNASEYRVFRIIENEIRRQWPRYRVFSQTSLGEIIRSPDPQAHSCINSKRVDVVVISPLGTPALVAEYQGGGHFQNSAAARDAVKKEALRRAGVAYLEILESSSDTDIITLIRREMVQESDGSRAQAPAFRQLNSPQPTWKGATARE
nr:DUF2726 domain-containing protein [Pelagibacterium limicola]